MMYLEYQVNSHEEGNCFRSEKRREEKRRDDLGFDQAGGQAAASTMFRPRDYARVDFSFLLIEVPREQTAAETRADETACKNAHPSSASALHRLRLRHRHQYHGLNSNSKLCAEEQANRTAYHRIY